MSNIYEQIFESSFKKKGDTYRFLDPITSEDLSPTEVPPGLLMDQRMVNGFNFLKTHGTRIQVELALTSHGRYADLEGVALGGHPVLLLEGERWSGDIEHDLNVAAQTSWDIQDVPVSSRTAENIEKDKFFKASFMRIRGSGVEVRFIDIMRHEDTNLPIDRLMDYWGEAWMDKHHGDDDMESMIAAVGYNNYREWYMCGMLGNRLGMLFEEGILPDATFLVGSTHADLKRKLELFGVNVIEKKHSTRSRKANQVLTKAIGTLSLTSSDLQ